MKVIFLGAGRGSRLQAVTSNQPKWLLKIAGQSILQHSVNVMHQFGIAETLIVRGALGGTILSPSAFYVDSPNTANMVQTLFSVREHLTGDVIVSYCDIVYEPRIVAALLGSTSDISVVIDRSWRNLFSEREDEPLGIAESCKLDGNRLISIGQPLLDNEEPMGQYIGLMRFSATGIEALTKAYDDLARTCAGRPWRNAPSFEKGYFTDLLQELIERGFSVTACLIDGGWMEFDTKRDVAFATALAKTGARSHIFDYSAMPPRPSVLSAGGVVTRLVSGQQEVLLVGSGSDGEWRIPKGMLEPGESIERAAIREVSEETGIHVEVIDVIGALSWTYSFGSEEWHEQCHFHRMRQVSAGMPKPDAEHLAAEWVPVGRAVATLMYDNERDILARSLAME